MIPVEGPLVLVLIPVWMSLVLIWILRSNASPSQLDDVIDQNRWQESRPRASQGRRAATMSTIPPHPAKCHRLTAWSFMFMDIIA